MACSPTALPGGDAGARDAAVEDTVVPVDVAPLDTTATVDAQVIDAPAADDTPAVVDAPDDAPAAVDVVMATDAGVADVPAAVDVADVPVATDAGGCVPGSATCASSSARAVCRADGLGTTTVACLSGANSTAACAAGVCALTCAAGYGDCDGNPETGCEAVLRTDARHCGTCANACAAGRSCVAGACELVVTPPSLSVARSGLGAAVGRDGRVYAIGGATAATRYSNAVEMWDPAGGATAWVTRASMPVGLWGPGVATGPDGRIYVFGGLNGSGPSARTFAYNPATNTWAELARLPQGRSAIAAATLGGLPLAIDGDVGVGVTDSVASFDPATNAWTTLAPTPFEASGSRAATAADGRVFVFGGYNNLSWSYRTSVYDPTARRWSAGPNMPEGRSSCGATRALDGRIHVVGGYLLPESTSNAHWALDPATRTWQTLAPLAADTADFGFVTLLDGRLLVIGGERSPNVRTAVVTAYSDDDAWR